jgi:hypothetical protein
MLPHLNARQDPGRWRPFFRQGAAPAAKMAGLENRRPHPGEELGFLSSAEQMQARGERKLARPRLHASWAKQVQLSQDLNAIGEKLVSPIHRVFTRIRSKGGRVLL